MPTTIIQVQTFMCPTGLGNPNASCRFHRASNNMTPDGKCPKCNLVLVQSTDPLDKITMTVMGEEDIETEIEEMLKDDNRKKEVSTEAKKNTHRAKRRDDIKRAIAEARKFEDK